MARKRSDLRFSGNDDQRPALSVEEAVRGAIQGLPEARPEDTILKATALRLARVLDDGAGLATAAVARELRLTVGAIVESGQGANGDDDDFLSGLGLPSAMGHSPLS